MILIFVIYAYISVAGLISRFIGDRDDPITVVLDLIWPLTIWYRAANYYLGKPVNMENYFLRKRKK